MFTMNEIFKVGTKVKLRDDAPEVMANNAREGEVVCSAQKLITLLVNGKYQVCYADLLEEIKS